MNGKLYLIPTTIGTEETSSIIPSDVINITKNLKYFIAEELRTTRRYLSKIGLNSQISELIFFELNVNTNVNEVENMLVPMLNGHDVGLISEAGVPAVADPGSILVKAAHHKKIKVIPLVGPNSILLTLMASGLNGQNFAFIGYLPIKADERQKRIKQLEYRAKNEQQTQLFIETPYRNIAMFNDLLQMCFDDTLLTIAKELTTCDELIITQNIKNWKNSSIPDINKKNTVFAIL